VVDFVDYAVRQITEFGEPVIIPAAGIPVTLPTGEGRVRSGDRLHL
jgi:hypothetical protein